jgi:hypothetical protein
MLNVTAPRFIFKITEAAVSLNCIFMVNFVVFWFGANEGGGHEDMYLIVPDSPIPRQSRSDVAVVERAQFKRSTRLRAAGCPVPSYAPKVRHRIDAFVVDHIAPFFLRQFFFCKLLFSQGVNLLQGLSLVRPVRKFALSLGLLCIVAFPAHASLTGTDRGVGGNTGAGSLSVSPTSNYTANSLAVLCLAYDNAGSAGSATIAPASATDTIGNLWTRQVNALYDNGAASAGVEIAIYTSFVSSFPTTASLTITWSNGSPVARFALHEFTSTTGGVAFVTGAAGTGATTGTPSVTSSSITNGDAIIGVAGLEGTDSWAGDSDTSNGSWSTHQHSGTGSGTSAISITSQRKIATGTATQTYNPTCTSGDTMIGWIAVTEVSLGMGQRIIRM